MYSYNEICFLHYFFCITLKNGIINLLSVFLCMFCSNIIGSSTKILENLDNAKDCNLTFVKKR